MGLITVKYENICSVSYDSICCVSNLEYGFDCVFDDTCVGSLPGTIHLKVDEAAIPVAIAQCKSPVSLKPKIMKLDELEKNRGDSKS